MAPDDFGGSVFNLNGFNQTIGPLSTTNVFAGTAGTGTPTIELNNGTLTILQTNITTGFNGVITGAGNLVINGNNSGQLILSNADSYTGITTINGGTLDGYGSGSISSSVVINGGTFEMDSANAFDSTTNTLTMGSGVTVNLNYSGSQTIAALYFGAAMQANGYWGAVGNASATYTDSRFTGPGLLYVCNVPNPTITPASTNVCAGMTTNASVPAAPGGSYSWFISNGTIVSGQSSNILTYTAWAYSPVTLNCYVTSVCGQESGGSQNVLVNVINCGNEVETTNVSYSAGSGATISASGAIGANWALNATTNLTAPLPWPTIQTGTVSSSPFTLTDPNATNCPQQFYYLTNTP
jgi:autotransporter-associated beta strand protein